MKKKDIKELKSKTISQISAKVSKNKLKLKEEMAEFYAKGDNNPKKIRQLKKDIAQMITIIREKEIEEEIIKDVKKIDKDKS